MGEASRRKKMLASWLGELSPDERHVAMAALRLGKAFPVDGACYRMTFFLRQFLRERHGINASAVVGFVNDGTDDLYGSHAWLEFNGKKVDLALARPLSPEVQKRGPILILDWRFADGWSGYTYHDKRPPEAVAVVAELIADPETQEMMQEAELLHSTMAARATSDDQMRAYLDAAPDRMGYTEMASMVDRATI